MSRKSQIKAIIDANIKRNGRKEITGPVLNAILNAMLDAGVIDITQDGQILPKDEDGNVEISSISMDGAVRYDVAQLLTEGQKEIARNNIGAPSNAAIVAENERAELAETELGNSVLAETERATQAESELSSRIDTIVQGRNVRDIVANYDELLAYDTSTLGDNDIIMVLLDSTKSGHTTYYKWHTDTQSWEFIGGLAFTYTKTEIDEKFRALHIIIPDIPEAAVEHPEEYQELLAQVDSLVRSAGADASFRMPIDTIGNVDVTFVKYNPAHIYLGIFADDRSVLYTINRTTSQPRSYSVEIVTKEFVTRAEFDAYSEGVAQELDRLSLKVGKFSEITPTLSSGVQIATLKKEGEDDVPLYAPQGGGGDDTMLRKLAGQSANFIYESVDGKIHGIAGGVSYNWVNSKGLTATLKKVLCMSFAPIVKTMQNTFSGGTELEEFYAMPILPERQEDGNYVEDISGFFNKCIKLTNFDFVKDWDVSHITSMQNVFSETSAETFPIADWVTSSLTNMQGAFGNNLALKYLDLSKWDTLKVTDMTNFVYECHNIETLGLPSIPSGLPYAVILGYGINTLKNIFMAEGSLIKGSIMFNTSPQLTVESVQTLIDHLDTENVGTLTLHAQAKSRYDEQYGAGACASAVIAKGWTLA